MVYIVSNTLPIPARTYTYSIYYNKSYYVLVSKSFSSHVLIYIICISAALYIGQQYKKKQIGTALEKSNGFVWYQITKKVNQIQTKNNLVSRSAKCFLMGIVPLKTIFVRHLEQFRRRRAVGRKMYIYINIQLVNCGYRGWR